MKLKATRREKMMDSAITKMRRPYNYEITKDTLDEAARETRQYIAELKNQKGRKNKQND